MGFVSWLNGVFGDWNTASFWSTGSVPGSGDQVSIAAAGTYDVTLFGQGAAASLTVDAAGATFYDAGSLSLGGTLALEAGTLALAYGAIDGGTLALQGGVFVADGGTLDGVAVQGVLGLQASQASLFVSGGLSLSGAGGSGTGSIAITGSGAALGFVGSQTLTGATIDVGSVPGQGGAASLDVVAAAGAQTADTLTLGAALWLRDLSGNGVLAIGASTVGTLANLPDVLLSEGTITVSGPASSLLVSGVGTFVNQGSLAVANGATLTIGCGGFSNTGTMSVSNATLALGGVFAASLLANLGALTLSNGTISIVGTASNAGGTLVIGTGSAIAASLGEVSLAGTLLGGVVQDGGDGLSFAPGTGVLSGVTYQGTLDLSEGGAVTLAGGASVVGVGGAGIASVLDTGAGSTLLLQGSETLDHAVLALGNAGTAAVLGTSDAWLASSATTAVLGVHLSVQQAGLLATIEANGSPYSGWGLSDTLINKGLIAGALTGGQLGISGFGTFINQGTITVSNGDTLTVAPSVFSNTGTILVGSGATAILGGPPAFFGLAAPLWSNTGQIIVSGGTLTLAGTVSTAQLGRISATGGVVGLTGTLSNAGATLTLGAGGLPAVSLSGRIVGGSIVDPGGLLTEGASGMGVLDGVSYQGTLGIAGILHVRDGLSLSGTAVLGAGSVLDFWGTQAFGGAKVQIGGAGTAAAIDVQHDYSVASGSTLTLSRGLTITQAGVLAAIGLASDRSSDGIVNDGVILAGVAGGEFTLGGADFSNQGSIAVSNGDTLALDASAFSNSGAISVTGAALSVGGSLTLAELGALTLSNATLSVTGTLDVAGTILSIGAGSAMGSLALTGTLQGGTIADGGGGLSVAGSATLAGVTYEGLLDLSRPFAQVSIADGFTLTNVGGTGSGTLLLTGAAARVVAAGSEIVNNLTIDLGSAASSYLGQPVPAAELAAGPGATLTLGAGAVLTETGLIGALGDASLGQWTDAIVNDGQITSGLKGGTLILGSSFFTNAGTLTDGPGAFVQTTNVGFINAGTIVVSTGGSFLVGLYDYFAAPDAGASVFTNDGTIDMAGGYLHEFDPNALFPIVKFINAPGAVIQGYGILGAPILNQGTIEATGSLELVGTVSGTGTIVIDAGSALNPAGGIAAGETVRFADPPQGSAGGTLVLLQPGSVAAGIAGLGTGDVLDLQTTHLTGIAVAGGTLVASTPTMTERFNTPGGVGASEVSVGTDKFGGSTIALTRQTIAGGAATIAVTQPGMLFWCSYLGDIFAGATKLLNGARISDWAGADHLDFTDLSPSSLTLSYSAQAGYGLLYLSEGATRANVTFFGTYLAADFHATEDGHGGTTISYHA
jgi:hypothetical protein